MKHKSDTWYQGKIRWFDDLSGQGVVRCDETDKCFYVEWTASLEEGVKRDWINRTTGFEIKRDLPIKFQLVIDSHYTQVKKLREV